MAAFTQDSKSNETNKTKRQKLTSFMARLKKNNGNNNKELDVSTLGTAENKSKQ